ncbi:hypothetical protein [Burkholderia metallica]|nr:hypothetical protein [Burkholderia metallica]
MADAVPVFSGPQPQLPLPLIQHGFPLSLPVMKGMADREITPIFANLDT